jgi:hypothetical protein
MTADEEAAYVREVASQKTAALRMSLDAVERQGMPFVGETGGVGPGAATPTPSHTEHLAQGSRRSIPLDPEMTRRLEDARAASAEHLGHDGPASERRAPRPPRLQR